MSKTIARRHTYIYNIITLSSSGLSLGRGGEGGVRLIADERRLPQPRASLPHRPKSMLDSYKVGDWHIAN